jgi:hypothetical protein
VPDPSSFPLKVVWVMVHPADAPFEGDVQPQLNLPSWVLDDASDITSLAEVESHKSLTFSTPIGDDSASSLSHESGVLRICGCIGPFKPKVMGKSLVFIVLEEVLCLGQAQVRVNPRSGQRRAKFRVFCQQAFALSPSVMQHAARAKKGQMVDIDGVWLREPRRNAHRFVVLRLWLADETKRNTRTITRTDTTRKRGRWLADAA